MPIPFKAIMKGQPGIPGGGKRKYYASVATRGESNLEDLIAKMSTFTHIYKPEVYRVVLALAQAAREELADGKIVRIQQFGSFYPTIRSEGKDTASEVTAKSILKTGILFRAAKRFEEAIAKASFQKIEE